VRCNQCRPLPEEVARAADLLGRRWALAILWSASEAGAVRFNEFKQTLEGIPPRVEYRLTEAGRRLRYVVEALNAFATSA
jgi:DNA-binding HxlR family transcriptional regulator